MRVIILGYGSRGRMYALEFKKSSEVEVVGACDVRDDQLQMARLDFGDKIELFQNANELFAREKFADLCVVSTQDPTHREYAIKAMELGYNKCWGIRKNIFKDVGIRFGISSSSVFRIFEYVAVTTPTSLPTVLGIDEFKGNYALKSIGYSFRIRKRNIKKIGKFCVVANLAACFNMNKILFL